MSPEIWHCQTDQLGQDDSYRIDMARWQIRLLGILVRIDVRKSAMQSVQAMAQFSEKNYALMLVENGRLAEFVKGMNTLQAVAKILLLGKIYE